MEMKFTNDLLCAVDGAAVSERPEHVKSYSYLASCSVQLLLTKW